MIVELIFTLIGSLFDLLEAALPDADLDLPDLTSFGSTIATKAAPLDRVFPVYELVVFMGLFLGVWLPAAVAYMLAVWIYKHLPVVGKG